jgi:hypothetical protein
MSDLVAYVVPTEQYGSLRSRSLVAFLKTEKIRKRYCHLDKKEKQIPAHAFERY